MENDFLSAARAGLAKGASTVEGAVQDAAVEHTPFMKGFVRLCTDGWNQGWHERNGGNLTYRMTNEDIERCKPFLNTKDESWVSMGAQADNLRGAYFVTTGAGRYMRNVQLDPAHNVGIVQINDAGDAWRIVWGLTDGGKPTSEFASHFMIHSVRMEATGGASRVLYHAHPINVIALTKILPLDSRVFTRTLWKAMTECIMVFPMGVGVVPVMVPGSIEIAQASGELMKTFDAVIWAQHGLFASGSDFDLTFGLMHTIEKAAKIHTQSLAINNGSDKFLNTISDDMLREIARSLNLVVREEFLD